MSILFRKKPEDLLSMGDRKLRKLAKDFDSVKDLTGKISSDINEFATYLSTLKKGKSKLEPLVKKRAEDLVKDIEKLRETLGLTEKDVIEIEAELKEPNVEVWATNMNTSLNKFKINKKTINLIAASNDFDPVVQAKGNLIYVSGDYCSQINFRIGHINLEWNGSNYVIVSSSGIVFLMKGRSDPIPVTSRKRYVIEEKDVIIIGEGDKLMLSFKYK